MVHILRAAALSFQFLPGLVLDTCSKSPEEPAERAAVLLWTAAHPLPQLGSGTAEAHSVMNSVHLEGAQLQDLLERAFPALGTQQTTAESSFRRHPLGCSHGSAQKTKVCANLRAQRRASASTRWALYARWNIILSSLSGEAT